MDVEQSLFREIVRNKTVVCGICGQVISPDDREPITYDTNGNLYHYLCGVIYYNMVVVKG